MVKNLFFVLSSFILNSNNLNNPIDIIKKYNNIKTSDLDDDEFEVIEIDLYEINKDIIKNKKENVLDYRIEKFKKNKILQTSWRLYENKNWVKISRKPNWESEAAKLGKIINDFVKDNQIIIFKNLCFAGNKNQISYNLEKQYFLIMQIFIYWFKIDFQDLWTKYLNLSWFSQWGTDCNLNLTYKASFGRNKEDLFEINKIWDNAYDKLPANTKELFPKELFTDEKFKKEFLFNNKNLETVDMKYNIFLSMNQYFNLKEAIYCIKGDLEREVYISKKAHKNILNIIDRALDKKKNNIKLDKSEIQALKYYDRLLELLSINKFINWNQIQILGKDAYKNVIKSKIMKIENYNVSISKEKNI